MVFEDKPNHAAAVSDAAFWQSRWDDGTTGWDAGRPAPALTGLLEHRPLRLESPNRRAIVPGCGSGHDVEALRAAGWDAVGYDMAPGAVAAAAARYPAADVRVANVFDLEDDDAGLVYEYTCYCAIDPARRPEYARLIRRLLAPGGLLVFPVFPLSDHAGGPPFGIDVGELDRDFGEGFERLYFDRPAASHAGRGGMEKLLIARKLP